MDQDLDFDSYSQAVAKLLVSEHGMSRIAQRGYRHRIAAFVYEYWMENRKPEHAAQGVVLMLAGEKV